jgi:hypothetical protein
MLVLLQAEPALSLARDQEELQVQINTTTSPLEPLDVPDPDLIVRSSDFVEFRVHEAVLAVASPYFREQLSQLSDDESVDGLPVLRFDSEDSELLRSLLSLLYPAPAVKPKSYEKVSYLLADCQR